MTSFLPAAKLTFCANSSPKLTSKMSCEWAELGAGWESSLGFVIRVSSNCLVALVLMEATSTIFPPVEKQEITREYC